jgi:hypothetical protein
VDVNVGFRGVVGVEDATQLDALTEALADADLSPDATKLVAPGIKDGGLTIGIALAGVGLSTVSTVISALNFWLSTRPKYSAEIKRGGTTFKMTGLDQRELLELSAALSDEGENLPLSVTLSGGD